MEKFLQNKINEACLDVCAQIEEHIRLALQPKPKWMPKFLWKWLIGKLCVIEHWGQQVTFSETNNPEPLTISHIKKATQELNKIDSKFYQEIGQLYGIKIVVDDTLLPDHWEIRCGRNVQRKIEEVKYGICEIKDFMEENNVAKNQR